MIPLFTVNMADGAGKAVNKVLYSGFIGQGDVVEEFELKLREYMKRDYVQTLNSGTSALHLALHLLKKPAMHMQNFAGIGQHESNWPGLAPVDEVLTTPLTCTATNWPILANNLNIKWVDIDPTTLNIDLDDLERKLSPTTKVIMLVHWGGYPVDLRRVERIQNKCLQMYGFKPAVIEDCAHAFGSKYYGKHLGSHGNMACYSFQAIKHFTTIDGGCIVLPHAELNNRARLLRWYGIDRDNQSRKDFRCEENIPEYGFKMHMNNVNAAVGIENLTIVDAVISAHRYNANYYDEQLRDVPGVTLLQRKPNFDSSFWIYSLLVENREGFMEKMRQHEIQTSQVHERNDKHSAVRPWLSALPTLERTIGKVVHIPVHNRVTDDQLEHIVRTIKSGW